MSITVSKILRSYIINSYLLKIYVYYASTFDVFLGNLRVFKAAIEHRLAAASALTQII